jgi:hypothetical protein
MNHGGLHILQSQPDQTSSWEDDNQGTDILDEQEFFWNLENLGETLTIPPRRCGPVVKMQLENQLKVEAIEDESGSFCQPSP